MAAETMTSAPSSPTEPKSVRSRRRISAFEVPLAIRLVEGAYVILLGFLVSQLMYSILTPLTMPVGAPAGAGQQQIADLTVMSRFDPFIGHSPVELPVETYSAATETSLNLRLVGTYVIGDEPSATVALENGDQRLFFIGDSITNGVTVRDILPDQVILSRNGITETLSLENREPTIRRGSAAPGSAPRTGSRPAAGDGLLSSYIELEPIPGRSGLVLNAGPQPMLFESAGLIDGDILVAVNGQPVSSNPQQVIGSMATLLSRGLVTVTIIRQGEEFDIVLDPSGLLE